MQILQLRLLGATPIEDIHHLNPKVLIERARVGGFAAAAHLAGVGIHIDSACVFLEGRTEVVVQVGAQLGR